MNTYSLACSACGKCCNTPPAMALPELFRHRDRFVGCIAIARVPRRRAGERVQAGTQTYTLDEADATAFEHLADALLHRTPRHPDVAFSIATQGFDYPSLARCPALADDGLCTLHAHGKPSMCEAVPLDPMVPDSMQHAVLSARNASSTFLGAHCIREGSAERVRVHAANDPHPHVVTLVQLVADGRVHDDTSRAAVDKRRTALALDKAFWGEAVFASLRRELFDTPAALERIAQDGFLTISLVPALLAVASHSDACRAACVAYIDSQLALIERNVGRALQRRQQEDRPATRELRAFADAYAHAKSVLSQRLTGRANSASVDAARAERWLFAQS